MLTAAAIAAADPGPFGSHLTVVARTGSTNEDLLLAAKQGAPTGRALIAEEQTRGRGRLGRQWHSPAGSNLYLSVLLRPSRLQLESFPVLALVSGVAVAEALIEVAALAARVKWPNDVLVGGRKISGILAEATDSTPPALVVGVGINVNQRSFPEALEPIATSVQRETGQDLDRAHLAATVLRSLHRSTQEAERGDVDAVLERWIALSSTIGRLVRTSDGLVGRVSGLDPTGALLVTDSAGAVFKVIGGPIEELG